MSCAPLRLSESPYEKAHPDARLKPPPAPLGEIRSRADWRAELVGAVEEGAAVARAEGAPIEPGEVLDELWEAHAGLTSSLQRDVAAGRPNELDAIAGAVLRAGERHGIGCPTIAALTDAIRR